MDVVTRDTLVVATDGFELRSEGDDGALLYEPATQAVTILNATAAAVYRLLDEPRPVTAILAALADEYAGMGQEAGTQVLDALQTLVAARAARVCDR